MTTTAPLVCREIVVTYPDGPDRRTILDNLDLEVAAGEIVTIAGDSGSGKSTLLTVAGLLRRSDSGEVTIAGDATSGLSERRRTGLRRDHIAFIYQSANLLPTLTAIEQLQLVGHIRGHRPSTTRALAGSLLDDLGLGDRAHQLPAQLSGGERQRVGIARALIAEPTVLIADEPTASLDPARADSVAAILADAAHERGIATLVVAHDDAGRRRADRRLRLHDGNLLEEPST
ncbi:MAG: ABC transporter ATP-binding protein [Microthrixaceae bacterium]|nr:ABC transporter ATP-binding protein [Microthrixaceae bacterium]